MLEGIHINFTFTAKVYNSVCDTKLNGNEGEFINNPRGKDRDGNKLEERFEMGCIRLTCPECKTVHYICNMCGGDGWYRGDSTGNRIACDNCNLMESERQRRGRY